MVAEQEKGIVCLQDSEQRQSGRTDYKLNPAGLDKGEDRPTALCEYLEQLKEWREKSSQSLLLVR